ncbi:MAG: reverse transcriptase domain-containing protein, partial [Bacteroidota bacterium]
ALNALGINDTLIKWIEIIYKPGKVNSCIQINGYIGKNFNLLRGVRQGCPVSPLLYVIAVETVSIYIRKNISIPGINFFGEEYKMINYADDTNLFLVCASAIQKVFETHELFKLASGARLNTAKTKIIVFNGQTIPNAYRRYVTDKMTVFGTEVGINGINDEENWEKVEKNLKEESERIPPMGLSIFSKLNLCKIYFLSKLWYLGKICSPTDRLISQAEILMINFYGTRRNGILLKKK